MDIKIGKTKSEKILGSMAQIAYFVQSMTECVAEGEKITTDQMEMNLARFIHMPLKAIRRSKSELGRTAPRPGP